MNITADPIVVFTSVVVGAGIWARRWINNYYDSKKASLAPPFDLEFPPNDSNDSSDEDLPPINIPKTNLLSEKAARPLRPRTLVRYLSFCPGCDRTKRISKSKWTRVSKRLGQAPV